MIVLLMSYVYVYVYVICHDVGIVITSIHVTCNIRNLNKISLKSNSILFTARE